MTQTKFQKFEVHEIARSDIKGAEYNPRIISEKAKTKLKKNLKKKGLLQPLVWNKRTGNLVSGHQRLAILDELEKSENYSLSLAIVDLSEKEEKEQNLFFNNVNAMGEWDLEQLGDLFTEADFDYIEAGFELADLNTLDIELIDNTNSLYEEEQVLVNPPKTPAIPQERIEHDSEEVDPFAHLSDEERISRVKDMKQGIKDEASQRNQIKPLFAIVFGSHEEREQFKDKYNLTGDFASYQTFAKILK